MNPVIGLPPLLAGWVQETESVPLPGVTTTLRGELGTVRAVTATRGADGELAPTALVATTSTYTVVPLARPVRLQAVTVAVQVAMGDPPEAAAKARAV